jgi:succinate dehydrogenase / fumarate reductase, membrane anchor subunit
VKASRHWWYQRVSAIVLLPLSLLFLFSFAPTLGLPLAQVLAIWSSPVHALVAIAFFAVLFVHLQQGLHEVVIDYVHGPSRRSVLLGINVLCIALPLLAIVAIARNAFFQVP